MEITLNGGKNLPEGYVLVQEIEARLRNKYLVAERFLKSSPMALGLIATNHRDSALQAFNAILQEKSSTSYPNRSFPIIEAILDPFKSVYEAITLFQGPDTPSITMILPNLFQYLDASKGLKTTEVCFEMETISHGLR